MVNIKRWVYYVDVGFLTLVANLVIKFVSFKVIIEALTNCNEIYTGAVSEKNGRRLVMLNIMLDDISIDVPWRVKCYEKALVALVIARIIGADLNIFFGLRRDGSSGMEAHAWTRIGDIEVTGNEIADEFQQVYCRGYKCKKKK